jgi:2-succinyl-6-hydroxy-2,4-cyclohexadiene-1-carboxylate synthase
VPESLALLHGFAATPRHWDRVLAALPPGRFDPIVPNLADADPLTPGGVAALVAASAPEPFVLAGYSMGGRLALHTALAMPERIERLVLVSTGAGIDDPSERAARLAADRALADEIEQGSIASFIERWTAVPLFAEDPEWVRREVAEDERRCSPHVLAACLRNLGPGSMQPMWERLGELSMPVAVLAGERDAAYVAHAQRLARALPSSRLVVVPAAGHRLALEAPLAVAAALG